MSSPPSEPPPVHESGRIISSPFATARKRPAPPHDDEVLPSNPAAAATTADGIAPSNGVSGSPMLEMIAANGRDQPGHASHAHQPTTMRNAEDPNLPTCTRNVPVGKRTRRDAQRRNDYSHFPGFSPPPSRPNEPGLAALADAVEAVGHLSTMLKRPRPSLDARGDAAVTPLPPHPVHSLAEPGTLPPPSLLRAPPSAMVDTPGAAMMLDVLRCDRAIKHQAPPLPNRPQVPQGATARGGGLATRTQNGAASRLPPYERPATRSVGGALVDSPPRPAPRVTWQPPRPPPQRATAPAPRPPKAEPPKPTGPVVPRVLEDGTVVKLCNCKKSKCLKLYCDCFALGVFCSGCACNHCLNHEGNKAHVDAIKESIKQRLPDAFAPKVVRPPLPEGIVTVTSAAEGGVQAMAGGIQQQAHGEEEARGEGQVGGELVVREEAVTGMGENPADAMTMTMAEAVTTAVGTSAAPPVPAPVTSALGALVAGGAHKRGCNCKKSKCLKKYCECFQANVKCTDTCRCDACANGREGGPPARPPPPAPVVLLERTRRSVQSVFAGPRGENAGPLSRPSSPVPARPDGAGRPLSLEENLRALQAVTDRLDDGALLPHTARLAPLLGPAQLAAAMAVLGNVPPHSRTITPPLSFSDLPNLFGSLPGSRAGTPTLGLPTMRLPGMGVTPPGMTALPLPGASLMNTPTHPNQLLHALPTLPSPIGLLLGAGGPGGLPSWPPAFFSAMPPLPASIQATPSKPKGAVLSAPPSPKAEEETRVDPENRAAPPPAPPPTADATKLPSTHAENVRPPLGSVDNRPAKA